MYGGKELQIWVYGWYGGVKSFSTMNIGRKMDSIRNSIRKQDDGAVSKEVPSMS